MLAEDPNYPPQQIINALASMISSTGSSAS